ncbi:MAG: GTPase domain-containing protein [Dermatophilus congolensis]|nr:GTPase domain-containing protein [Dermatophilus congolensis]
MGYETGELLTAVRELREEVARTTFPLDVSGAAHAREAVGTMLNQLDDYILPRLENLDAPLLAVVGGSTGAGKSTLVNSLVGSVVSRSGVLRPTTRASVLVHHPEDAGWFTTPRVLPNLVRISGEAGGQSPAADDPGAVRLVASEGVAPGVALLDAPDIDSVVSANRDLARQLLAAADLWVFVTTAARYADAVPWELLRDAVERGTSIAMVLDRVPPGAEDAISEHLAEMLITEGLRHAPVFTISEVPLDENGLLPLFQTQPLKEWLGQLGDDARARGTVVKRTLAGALDSLDRRTSSLADSYSMQIQTREQLEAIITTEYAAALDRVSQGMSDGSLLRGEVLARWHEFVGTGEFLKSVEIGFGRLRDRITAAVTGRPAPGAELGEALQSGVAELLYAHAQQARADVVRRWEAVPGGERITDARPDVARTPDSLVTETDRLVRAWQGDILTLVGEEGKDRRTTARVLAIGVNSIGFVLMLVVFSHTAGITGGEVGIAGGSAVLAQRLLEAVFGDQAVRNLATKARKRLLERAEELFAQEQADVRSALDPVALDYDLPHRLLDASANVKAAR